MPSWQAFALVLPSSREYSSSHLAWFYLTVFVSAPSVWRSDCALEIQGLVRASPTTTGQFDPKLLFAAVILGIFPGFAQFAATILLTEDDDSASNSWAEHAWLVGKFSAGAAAGVFLGD
jgi:hypothetical protein